MATRVVDGVSHGAAKLWLGFGDFFELKFEEKMFERKKFGKIFERKKFIRESSAQIPC